MKIMISKFEDFQNKFKIAIFVKIFFKISKFKKFQNKFKKLSKKILKFSKFSKFSNETRSNLDIVNGKADRV